MKLRLSVLFLLSSLLAFGQAVSGISPANAAPRSSVTISGTNLDGVTRVSFGGVSASTFSYDSAAGTIKVTLPTTAKSGAVVVTTPVGTSADFAYTIPLTISTQPAHDVISAEQSKFFFVTVGGGAVGSTYSYQWKRTAGGNTVNVGGNSSGLYLPLVSSADVGDYMVTVSDGTTTVNSISAALRLATEDVWTWRNPTTTGNDLWAVAYGAGRYAAVGRAGTVLTSTDGSAWTPVTQLMPTLFTNVVFADSKFVAVGSNGSLVISSDLESGSVRNVGEAVTLYGVARNATTWVVTGSNGAIYTSADAMTWTRVPAANIGDGAFTSTLERVIATSSGFMTVSLGGHVLVGDSNGTSWTVTQPAGSTALYDIQQRTTGAVTTTLVAGASKILRSTNGTSWTEVVPAPSPGTAVDWNRVIATDSGWVALGGNYSSTYIGYVTRSTDDGVTWTAVSSPSLPDSPQFIGGTFAAGAVTAVGTLGRIARSTDGGATWQNFTGGLTFPGEMFAAATGTVGTLVAGQVGQVYFSANHETGWARANLGQDSAVIPGSTRVYGAVQGAGSFVLIGGNDNTTAGAGKGYIFSSNLSGGASGSTWSRVDIDGPHFLAGVAYDSVSGRFVTAGAGSKIYHAKNPALSSGADAWTAVDKPGGSTAAVRAATAAGGRFVLTGDNGTAFTSADGVAWTLVNTGASVSLEAVAGNGAGTFVAGGWDGASSILMRSTDSGATWSRVNVPFTGTIRGMTYADGRFRTVGGTSTMLISADGGATWTAETSQFSGLFRAIVRTPKGYVAGGFNGAIATLSQPAASPVISDRTLTAGATVPLFKPVIANGGAGSLTYSVSPALPAGLSLNASTGEITGTVGGGTSVPLFVGSDNFAADNLSTKWPSSYRTLGSGTTNGLLSVNTTAGRLDFSKGAGDGSHFRRWDGDPQVANITRTSASFATSWQSDVTVTNTAAVTGSEYSSVGLQAASDGGWAAMMVTRSSGGITVRGESSSIALASSPVATISSGEGVRLRFSWDAATRTLKGAYSTNGGTSYTDLLTLASTTWAGSSSRGFFHEVFANSTIATAVAAGSNHLDDFSVTAKSVAAAIYTVTATDAVGVTVSVPVTIRVLPADAVLWEQFPAVSAEQAPARTVHAAAGKVYVPWSVNDRSPDMVGGRLIGALARLNELNGSLDTSFQVDRRIRAVSHVVPLADGRLLAAVRVGDSDSVVRFSSNGAVDGSFVAPRFARGIRFITLQADGKVLVASTDGLEETAPNEALAKAAPSILRLNTDGTLDSSFSVALNPTAVLFSPPVVDSSGLVYLAGLFSSVNGTPRVNVARVSPTGAVDTAFADPASIPGFGSSQARAVLIQSDGKAVVLGDFRSTARGTSANPMMAIRFTTAGALDGTYARPLRSEVGINTAVGIRLRHGVILTDDRIVAVSDRLVRLNTDGTRDINFVSRAFGKEAFWVSRASDGRYFVADQVSVAGADGSPVSLAHNGIACFAADGTPDFSFQTGGWGRSSTVTSGVPLSDGSVWVAGTFNRYGASSVPGAARFTATGTLATPQMSSSRLMSSAMVVPAGSDKVFVTTATPYTSLETYSESLVRVGTDGAVDNTFVPVLPAGYSLGSASLAESPGGKVLLFQGFISAQAVLNGESGDALLRLNANGSRDTGFTSTLSSFASVERLANNAVTMIRTGGFFVTDVLSDGRVLSVGAGVDGTVKLVRLKADGSVDSTFNAVSLGTINPSVAVTSGTTRDPVTNTTAQFPISTYSAGNLIAAARQGPDGKVYVSGRLNVAGSPRGLVRLTASGTIDTTFAGTGLALSSGTSLPGASALVFDESGRLYVAGRFDSFNGNPVPGLFRLNADGGFDAAWQPGIAVVDAPRATATLRISGGNLYVFGTVARAGDTLPRSWAVAEIGSAPVIASISGANAAAGATVTISGSNLAGVTRVTFGGLGAAFTHNSTAGTISATVPSGATSGQVVVTTTSGGSSAGFNFTVALSIAAQPASAVIRNGGSFTLQVRPAGGTPPYSFQWRKGSEVLPGATSAVYSRSNVASAETGTGAYNVVVADSAGASITSSTAVVSLASASGTFLSDASFIRPDFKQDTLAGRVTVDVLGRVYATWTNGNYLSGAGNQLRGAVVRLKPDGSVDESFNLGTALIDAWPVVPLPDGKILVGGVASNESVETGFSLPRVFRFNADGSRDFSYASPHFATSPRFMTLQPDGKLLVVATSGSSANGGIPIMARLNPDGSPDGSFIQPVLSTNGSIFAPPVVDPAGRIYVGGIFSTINGVARPAVARLSPNGAVDTGWTPSGFTLTSSSQIRGLALQTQGANAGKLLVAGGAINVTGSSENRPVVRLNQSGEIDATFTLVTQSAAGMSVRPRLLSLLPDDRFYVVGSSVARFLANGEVDSDYTRPAFSTEFFWMDVMADGRVVVPPEAGATVNGVAATSLVRFTATGAVDTSFNAPVFNREVYPGRFAVLGDGKLLTWGGFDRSNGTARPGFARFNLDGTLETSYNVTGIADLKYIAFAELGGDGKILAGTRVGASLASVTPGISRLNADGTVDGSFALDSQLTARTDGLEFRLLPDNKVAVWSFSAQGVVSDNNLLLRLTSSGTIDPAFNATGFDSFGAVYRGTNEAITSITLGAARVLAYDASGRLIGRATTGNYPANATALDYTLMRVNTDGSRDMTFSAPVVAWSTATSFPTVTDAQTNGGVAGQIQTTVVSGAPFSGVLPMADGNYLVFGIFQSLSGQTARGLARLASNGALDTTFNVGSGAELRYQPGRFAQVQGVSAAADGKLWVTGAFDTFNGYAAPGIVRLNADGTVDTTFATDIFHRSYLGGLAQVGFAPNGRVYVSSTYSRPGDPYPTAFQAITNTADAVSPVITSVSPNPVVAGGSLTITGNNLPASGTVSARIGNVSLTDVVINASPAGISATVPSTVPTGAQVLTVTLPGNLTVSFALQVVSPTTAVTRSLINGAVRSSVGAGAPVLLGSFTVEGAIAKRMMVRAVGPTLATFGLTGVLADPIVEVVHGGTGQVIASNNDWGLADNASEVATVTAQVGAFGLTAGGKDAVILGSFSPGTYQVRLSGSGATTGACLLEIYDTDSTPRLVQLATRAMAGGASAPLIQGFVATNIPAGRSYLIRALGPSLGAPGSLADPSLAVFASGGATPLASNDNWGGGPVIETAAATVGAMPLPAASKDAALLFTPPTSGGGAFTVQVLGVGSTSSGLVLLEIHELDERRPPAFAPALLSPPENTVVPVGQPFTVGVVTVAKPAPAYQWRRGGTAIAGATNPGFSVFSASASDAGSYDVVITNPSGTFTSPAATVALTGGTGGTHSSDLDLNFRVSLIELTRVIELYNARNGTTRTGCYAVATTTTEDGFVSDPARVSAAVVTLTRYHSADSNRDGKISLTELTRVIELYNYRSGTTRTGQYKIHPGSEDGFAPGP